MQLQLAASARRARACSVFTELVCPVEPEAVRKILAATNRNILPRHDLIVLVRGLHYKELDGNDKIHYAQPRPFLGNDFRVRSPRIQIQMKSSKATVT